MGTSRKLVADLKQIVAVAMNYNLFLGMLDNFSTTTGFYTSKIKL
jgi:hypothetical protein